MRGPHNIWRLVRTGATLERTGAMAWFSTRWRAAASADRRADPRLPFRWLGYQGRPRAAALTRALTALGPAYIKFGQILSTRPDVVGDDPGRQLKVLQDKLPPSPATRRCRTIEHELDMPVDAVFSSFPNPSPRPRSRRSTRPGCATPARTWP